MSDVDKLAEQIAEKLRPAFEKLPPGNKSHDENRQFTAQLLREIIKEAPIQIIHHSPKDAATCPNCRPELDAMLNEAREQGRRIGRLTGKQELMAR